MYPHSMASEIQRKSENQRLLQYQRPYFAKKITSPYQVTIVMVLLNTYGTHKAHFLVDPCVCVRALASNLCVLFLMTKNMIIMKDTLFKESLRGKCN